jgi:hypothetical protein
MPEEFRLDNLTPHGIAQILSSPDYLLPPSEAVAVHDFIDRIGGIDNAWLAVDMLSQLEA